MAQNVILRIIDWFSWANKVDKRIICEICETERIKIERNENRKNTFDYFDEKSNNVLFTASLRGPNYGKGLFERMRYGKKDPKIKKITFGVYPGEDSVDSVFFDATSDRGLAIMKNNGCLELLTQRIPHEKLFTIARHFDDRKIF